jgi:hypothetical protein
LVEVEPEVDAAAVDPPAVDDGVGVGVGEGVGVGVEELEEVVVGVGVVVADAPVCDALPPEAF